MGTDSSLGESAKTHEVGTTNPQRIDVAEGLHGLVSAVVGGEGRVIGAANVALHSGPDTLLERIRNRGGACAERDEG